VELQRLLEAPDAGITGRQRRLIEEDSRNNYPVYMSGFRSYFLCKLIEKLKQVLRCKIIVHPVINLQQNDVYRLVSTIAIIWILRKFNASAN
jgi:hypothetical protein